MITRFLPRSSLVVTLKGLIRKHEALYWATAWGSDNGVLPELLRHQAKIRRLVVGTHFYQTAPDFLQQLSHLPCAQVVSPEGATFHPKLYLFKSRDRATAIIGSANFTHAAFSGNVESCLLIEGDPDQRAFLDIQDFIERTGGQDIDDDFLRAYRLQYDATRANREKLQKFVHLRRPTAGVGKRRDPLEMTWNSFVAGVRQDKASLKVRLEVITRARMLFAKPDGFSSLTTLQRKAVAGTLGSNEIAQFDGLDWGYFGSMRGAGTFRNRINNNSRYLSDALDHIPLAGPVVQRDYDHFRRTFLRAFKGQARSARVPPASRLLAMKRPDYFVCFDRPNRVGLAAAFGIAPTALTLASYWTDLIEPTINSRWWQAQRPAGVEGRIWDARAAFLDAIYYDPT
jgi:hypothetical protein